MVGSVVLSVVLVGCQGPTDNEVVERRLQFTQSSVNLPQLDSLELRVEIVRGEQATPTREVTFSTRDTTIVRVSQAGVVRSVGPTGTATVTARLDSLAASTSVHVLPVAEGIRFGPDSLVLPQEGSLALTAVVVDRLGVPMSNLSVTLEVLNPWVIHLSNGMLTVVGAGTEGLVSAVGGNVIDTAHVRIAQYPTRLTVSSNAIVVRRGESVWLGSHLYDLYDDDVVDVPIIRTSVDSTIARVPGDVYGVAVGQTLIILSAAQFADTVPVTVMSDTLDPRIAYRLPTPGAAVSMAQAYVLAYPPDYPSFFVTAPDAGQVLRVDWNDWGFTDTLSLSGGPREIVTGGRDGPFFVTLAGAAALGRLDPVVGAETGEAQLGNVARGVETSLDGTRVFVLREDGMLVAVDATTMAVVDSLPVHGAVEVRRDPTAPRLFMPAPDSGFVWVVRSDSLAIESQWPVGNRPTAVEPGAARDELYVADEAGNMAVLRLSTGQLLNTVSFGEPVTHLAARVNGSSLEVFVVAPAGRLYGVVAESGNVVCTVTTGGAPGEIRMARDGWLLAVMNGDGWVDFLDISSLTNPPGC